MNYCIQLYKHHFYSKTVKKEQTFLKNLWYVAEHLRKHDHAMNYQKPLKLQLLPVIGFQGAHNTTVLCEVQSLFS